MTFKEQIETVWTLARQVLQEQGEHHPQAFLTGPDGKLAIVALVLPAGVRPRQVFPDLLRRYPSKSFIFVTEAWGLDKRYPRDGRPVDLARATDDLENEPGREEILVAICVSPDYQETRTIAFERTADEGKIVFTRETDIISPQTTPGARMEGAFVDMVSLLQLTK